MGAKSMRRLRAGWGSLGDDAGRKMDTADDSTVAWQQKLSKLKVREWL